MQGLDFLHVPAQGFQAVCAHRQAGCAALAGAVAGCGKPFAQHAAFNTREDMRIEVFQRHEGQASSSTQATSACFVSGVQASHAVTALAIFSSVIGRAGSSWSVGQVGTD